MSETNLLIAVISVAVALGGLILTSMYRMETRLRQDMKQGEARLEAQITGLREELTGLRERMSHLEGLLEGLREAIVGRAATR